MNETNDAAVVDGSTNGFAEVVDQPSSEPARAPGPVVEAQREVRRHGRRLAKARAALEKWREARAWMRTPASKRSRFGLDWMNFFMADVETGFGTFVAFYLAGLGWSKGSVGLALGAGQIAAVIGQIPGGALVDAMTWKRAMAAIGILMFRPDFCDCSTLSAGVHGRDPTRACIWAYRALDCCHQSRAGRPKSHVIAHRS
jgi:hypothetical protein